MINVCVSKQKKNIVLATWLDLNQGSGNWKFVDQTCKDINVLVINDYQNHSNIPADIRLYFEVGHNYEDQIKNIFYNHYCAHTNDQFAKDRVFTVTNAVSFSGKTSSPYILHNDLLFNRTKAYFSNFEFTSQAWNHCGLYEIPSIYTCDQKTKIFICPNGTMTSTHNRFLFYRPKLADFIQKNYCTLGHLSNPLEKKYLASMVDYPDLNLSQIQNLPYVKKPFVGFSPVHHAYYQDTFLSIYVETVEIGKTVVVTEKTYCPLITGHFILPFSSQGLIRYLKSLGFAFPDFIDYSYDCVSDSDQRFNTYCDEITRLLSMPKEKWKQHWNDNFTQVIKHNQQLFFDKNYDKLCLNSIANRI